MKHINWWAVIAVVSLILNFAVAASAVKAQISPGVSIPILTPGQAYEVRLTNNFSCVELEEYLGLSRGDIVEKRVDGSDIYIKFRPGFQLDQATAEVLSAAIGKAVKDITTVNGAVK